MPIAVRRLPMFSSGRWFNYQSLRVQTALDPGIHNREQKPCLAILADLGFLGPDRAQNRRCQAPCDPEQSGFKNLAHNATMAIIASLGFVLDIGTPPIGRRVS